MNFRRGEVYKIVMTAHGAFGVGDRERDKYVIVLQNLNDPALNDVAVVVCSTDRDPARAPHAWEQRIDNTDADCFDRPTIVDGRWVFTVAQRRFENAQPALGILGDEVMDNLGDAIGLGLQLYR